MKIAIIDPFMDVSHAHWADGIVRHSKHEIEIYSNPPRHWKWQMIGGTLEIAERIKENIALYDLLLATDMLDLPTFLGYLKGYKIPPAVIYFHENQITYPWSDSDEDLKEKRDHHYGFMNLRSAYLADHIVFNSNYHFSSFFEALPKFQNQFPSIKWPFTLDKLKSKSSIIPIGFDQKLERREFKNDKPVFIWNHRWEYDKGPEVFFKTLFQLDERNIDFELIVLGKPYRRQPPCFAKAKEILKHKITHWGYVESKEGYYQKVLEANILLVTSRQDFFGISVVEAMLHGCYPLLPNRLAYAEHLPRGEKDIALYEEGKLIDKLIELITIKRYLNADLYQEFISKYYWENVILTYDALFEGVALELKMG